MTIARLLSAALMLLVASASYAQIPTDSLATWFPFSGDATDASGNGNDGTVIGATLTADRFGNPNSAYSFNGTNNAITANTVLNGSTNSTMCFWYNTANASQNPVLVYEGHTGGSGFGLLQANGSCGPGNLLSGLTGGINCDFLNSTTTVNVGQWQFATLVKTGNNFELYLDTVLVETGTSIQAVTTGNLFIGGHTNPITQNPFAGSIDDVCLYTRALSFCEIVQIYNCTNPAIAAVDTMVCPGDSTNVLIPGSNANSTYQLVDPVFAVPQSAAFYGNGDSLLISTGALTVSDSWLIQQTDTASGCQWLHPQIVAVNVGMEYAIADSATICAGDTHTFHDGTTATASTVHISFLSTNTGCDSTYTTTLTVLPLDTSSTSATACDSINWQGNSYTASGIYSDTLTNANGCDSILTLNLTINNSTSSVDSVTACDSYMWLGNSYSSSGTYSDTISNAAGCDSNMTLVLTILNSYGTIDTVAACDSYLWQGVTYTNSGTFAQLLMASNGCDSVLSLLLTINNSFAQTDSVSGCDSAVWHGNTYTASGLYYDSLTSASGCDSIYTLHLTIGSASNTIDTVTACNSYSWEGTSYTTSGTYTDTLVSASGCDSMVTLQLTIVTSSSSNENISACDGYDWNGQTYTASGIYNDTLVNAAGCDSLATLVLSINQSSNTIDTIAACNSYVWQDSTYTESTTITDTLTSANGCDSIVTLAINVTFLDTTLAFLLDGSGAFALQDSAEYQWFECTPDLVLLPNDTLRESPPYAGVFALEITYKGCVDTTACYAMSSGIGGINAAAAQFQLLPNPAADRVELVLLTPQSTGTSANMYASNGMLVKTVQLLGKRTSIDISDLPAGIYYIRQNGAAQKLIITK